MNNPGTYISKELGYFIDEGADTLNFVREFYHTSAKTPYAVLTITNGSLATIEAPTKTGFIESVNQDSLKPEEIGQIITFDIEAYLDDQKTFVAYACGWYDGENYHEYYLTEYNDPSSMIQSAFRDMLTAANHNKVVYIHNAKNYDNFFIVKALLGQGFEIYPLFKDGKIISIRVSSGTGKNKISIKVRDSYLMLPSSLAKLGIPFQVPTLKGFSLTCSQTRITLTMLVLFLGMSSL